MATITIRNLDDELKVKLRMEAARHGHSMEEEARIILRRALERPAERGLGSLICQRFAGANGVNLEPVPRTDPPRSVDFDE